MKQKFTLFGTMGKALFLLMFLCASASVYSQTPAPIVALPFLDNQNFNGYDGLSTLSLPLGWTATATGTGTFQGQGDGTSAANGFWSYGSVEYSMGSLPSAATGVIVYKVKYINNTGAPITSLRVSWNYEQWRYGGNTTGITCAGLYALAGNASLAAAGIAGTAAGANGTPLITARGPIALNNLNIAAGDSFGIQFSTNGTVNGISIDDYILTACNTTQFVDADADGFGRTSFAGSVQACIAPPGFASSNTDCNDLNGTIWTNATPFYIDNDGDNYDVGLVNPCSNGTNPPPGYSSITNGPDCNDNNFTIYNGYSVFLDRDSDDYKAKDTSICIGTGPIPVIFGLAGTELGTDCDDANPFINGPDTIAFLDYDVDGFGTGALDTFCSNLTGWSAVDGDCNDSSALIGLPNTIFYADADGDTFGDANFPFPSCPGTPPPGFVADSTDCDDTDPVAWTNDSIYIDFDADGYDGGKASFCHNDTLAPDGYSFTTLGTDCDDADTFAWQNPIVYIDFDNDGYDDTTTNVCYGDTLFPGYSLTTLGDDCDDSDSSANVLQTLFVDFDLDGYDGGIDSAVCYGLTIPVGFSDTTLGSDCNDSSALDFPGQIWYKDNDGDGYGNPALDSVSCTRPVGYGPNTFDCNDADSLKWRLGVFYKDLDADAWHDGQVTICYGAAVPGGYLDTIFAPFLFAPDCNDTNPSINGPIFLLFVDNDNDGFGVDTASLYCNNLSGLGYSFVDGDCDDNNVSITVPSVIYYMDADGDTFGDPLIDSLSCLQPPGYVTNSADCDDTDPDQYPGQVWFFDNDGDGYGDFDGFPVPPTISCIQPPNTTIDSTDCNDSDPTRWQPATLFVDLDGDNYDLGDAYLCIGMVVPAGYSAATFGTDCNDGDVFSWQWDSLYADMDDDGYDGGIDSICFGASYPAGYDTLTLGIDCDDADSLVTLPSLIYYADLDGDTVGAGAGTLYCSDPGVGYSLDSTDCDDTNDSIWDSSPLYVDGDADGYHGSMSIQCYGATIPAGFTNTTLGADCDDADNTVWTSRLLYIDADLDRYNAGQSTECYGATLPLGFDTTTLGSDCDDNNPNKWRSQTVFVDSDNDTYTTTSTTLCYGATLPSGYRLSASTIQDCNDNDNTKYQSKTVFVDSDNDGYTVGNGVALCYGATVPSGYKATANGTDCNDNNPNIYPGAPEQPGSNIDYNCNGFKDGIDDINASVSSVYPNPGTNYAIVELTEDWTSSSVEVTITDLTGRVVSTQKLDVAESAVTVNTATLNAGVYVFAISDSKNTATIRWIKNQ